MQSLAPITERPQRPRMLELLQLREIVRAAAVERGGRVHVRSDAGGRAGMFDFSVASWIVQGHTRAKAIGARVELELRRRGARWQTLSVRIES